MVSSTDINQYREKQGILEGDFNRLWLEYSFIPLLLVQSNGIAAQVFFV